MPKRSKLERDMDKAEGIAGSDYESPHPMLGIFLVVLFWLMLAAAIFIAAPVVSWLWGLIP